MFFIQLNPTCDPFAFNAIKGKDEGESETYKTDSNAIYWRPMFMKWKNLHLNRLQKKFHEIKTSTSHETVMINLDM
jgi:hypothetical protein